MAQTEHLPILRYALRATQDGSTRRRCLHAVCGLRIAGGPIALSSERTRAYRRVGQDLRDGTRRLLRLVVRANARRDKSPVLSVIREEVEELKVLLRLCHDAKAFANFNSFEHAITQVVDIAKQNEGWLKSQQKGPGPTGADPTGAGQNRQAMPDGLAAPSVP